MSTAFRYLVPWSPFAKGVKITFGSNKSNVSTFPFFDPSFYLVDTARSSIKNAYKIDMLLFNSVIFFFQI